MGKLFLKGFSLVIVAASLAACGNIKATGNNQVTSAGQISYADPNSVIQPAPSNYMLQKFTWDVAGSGDINFTVVPSGNDFVINVQRYNYRSMNVTLRMSANESQAVYSVLRNVFLGYDGFINGTTYYAGTTSTISMMDKNSRVYTIREPKLYSGNNAALTELFRNITTRIYTGN